MLNIIDLEKRWLRYKIKSYIPHATIVVSLIILIVLASIILKSQNNNESKTTAVKNISQSTAIKVASPKKNTEEKTILTSESEPQKKELETVVRQSTQTKLQPSLSFMKDMQNSSLPYYQEDIHKKSTQRSIKKNPSKTDKKKVLTQTTIITEPSVEKKVIVQEEPKVIKAERIIINRKETRDDINSVIKRFKVNHNPALSLFVAKKYYEIGNYHESYNYALITNQINKEIESSWIIFAKSLVKLDKRDKAVNILQEYIKSSDSHTARLLLEEILSGKFK